MTAKEALESLRRKHSELEQELELFESCFRLEQAPLPCGHSQQYAWSKDSTCAKIICLRCRVKKLEEVLGNIIGNGYVKECDSEEARALLGWDDDA